MRRGGAGGRGGGGGRGRSRRKGQGGKAAAFIPVQSEVLET